MTYQIEKALKAYIKQQGGAPKYTHKLTNLAKEAENFGLPPVSQPLIDCIQCPADVRYGDISVTLDEAIKAHHASIQVCMHPIEGERWIVTLGGVGRDYPPTDEAGFLEFARSLRVPLLYDLLKDAQPLSPIYSYRRTENCWRHYERLQRLPDGVVAIGDAVCVFNPVYGQGMTTAALGAITLDRCLKQSQLPKGFPLRFHKQLAQILKTPWLMATGEDSRWSTTVGAKPGRSDRWVQKYLDRVTVLMQDNPVLLKTFAEVVHMVKPPTVLFAPNIVLQVLASYGKRLPTEIKVT